MLSSSSVTAYSRCHWRWYLSYVERRDSYQSTSAAIGIAAHAGIEAHYRTILERGEQLTRDVIYDIYRTRARLELLRVREPSEDDDKATTSGERALEVYLDDVAPGIVPVMVEEGVTLDIGGITYSLHPDLIDAEHIIRDHKFTKGKLRDPSIYAFAMNGYAVGYRAMTGEKERDVQLDVIVRLKRDRPYHVPYSNGGPITGKAVRSFMRELEAAAAGIERQDFAPTGLTNGSCFYCPVRYACTPYKENARAHDQDQA